MKVAGKEEKECSWCGKRHILIKNKCASCYEYFASGDAMIHRLEQYRRPAMRFGVLFLVLGGFAVLWDKNPALVPQAIASIRERLASPPPRKLPRTPVAPRNLAALSGRSSRSISVYVSPHIEKIIVPHVKGVTLESAESIASQKGFSLIERGPRVSKLGVPEGMVLHQWPAPSRFVPRDTPMYVVVSDTPPETPEPMSPDADTPSPAPTPLGGRILEADPEPEIPEPTPEPATPDEDTQTVQNSD